MKARATHFSVLVVMLAFAGVGTLTNAAQPKFDLVGFATVAGLGRPGTTGGSGGAHLQVTNATGLQSALENDTPALVELLNDIDLSALANQNSPTNFQTGVIRVGSHKTVFSRGAGVAVRRGSLLIKDRQNVIIRNLLFRDLWVFDPSGNYDTWGWDYVSLENSHHVWVDHCDFEKVYDGMFDAKGGSDFITVSWSIFRDQKKCHLIGHSENAGATDRTHLNVTFHHNWYDRAEERIPRMRFGNAHVFNNYSVDLKGRGIQSTTEAATLVENVYFHEPLSGSRPTVEENGGGTGTVKVASSIIVNRPGVNVVFREWGASNFVFNAPFAAPAPPYAYTLDATTNVPSVVTNYAGTGQVDFELWQMLHFTPAQLTNSAVSGRTADADGDGANNFDEYRAGTNPTNQASVLRIRSITRQSNDVVLAISAAAGRTAVVQSAVATGVWNFVDVSPPLHRPGTGDVVTNFVDTPASPEPRVYRVRTTP
jgi:pectate lyase